MNDGGGGGEQPFFGFRSNLCAITRLKTLATQATVKQVDVFDLRKSLIETRANHEHRLMI